MREETVEALKYQAESRQVEAGKGSGPAVRGGATLGDLLKDKLAGTTPKAK